MGAFGYTIKIAPNSLYPQIVKNSPPMSKEVLYAVSASMLWGVFPLYLRTLAPIPALEILAHRIIWAFVCAIIVLCCRREGLRLVSSRLCIRTIGQLGASALLLSANWLLYIWAVNANYVVEASLGYFIAPLVTILFGAVFLQERLQTNQKAAVIMALLGIGYVAFGIGAMPWLGLAIATIFAGYTLLKKLLVLDVVTSLALEMMALALPAALYVGYLEMSGRAHTSMTAALKMGSIGLVTALLLLVFSAGARKLPLGTLGFLQYLTPSCQFLIGIFLLHEPFSVDHLIGFSLIWLALVLYWSGSVSMLRRTWLRPKFFLFDAIICAPGRTRRRRMVWLSKG
jgi:chloramphenicol-sensitive protein RarD